MDPVTYSLTSHYPGSEIYYRRVREFTNEVIQHAAAPMPAVAEFMEYVRKFELEELRQNEEFLLELLSFCLLWNSYGGYALAVRRAPFVTLARMAEWRKYHQRWKPAIDFSRGILITLFLFPRRGKRKPVALPHLPDIDRLCMWLEATGEFHEQALRFIRWRAFWETLPAASRKEMSTAAFVFADWFTLRSEEVLGEFTTNIEPFLLRSRQRYRWREDRVHCTRPRVEYHLNMVGAEITNRAFRAEFKTTATKAVLVPGCLRSRTEISCQASRVSEGLRCEGCLPQCRVNQLREMGKKYHFTVYIVPHASDISRWAPQPGKPCQGIVAAACVPTLLEGGWELKRYRVPAQCVLLDYSGCMNHWQGKGVPTTLSLHELKQILVSAAPEALT